jgi:hypothetical protein
VNRTKVFISYSHQDQKWLDLLLEHLEPFVEMGLEKWSDKEIQPGQEWPLEIEKSLDSAKVAVLLVSIKFLNSKFIKEKELPRFLGPHNRGELTILPVLISSCKWEVTKIGRIQSPVDVKKPLNALRGHKKDKALLDIAEAIHAAWEQQTYSQAVPEEEASRTVLLDLRQLAERHAEMPAERVDACFRRAVNECHAVGKRKGEISLLQDVFPQLPTLEALGWPQLLNFFDDTCKPSPELLQALERQLSAPAPQPSGLSDSCTFVALVLKRSPSWTPTARSYTWWAFLAQGDSGDYNKSIVVEALERYRQPIKIDDLKGDNSPIASIVALLLAWIRCNTSLPVLEIFAPEDLLDAPWAELVVKDASGNNSTLLKEVPFLLRPVDRLEEKHNSNRERLKRKIQVLAAGKGQWCTDDLASNADHLSASLVESDEHAGIKRLKALPVDQSKRERWFSALIASMVPIAIWYRRSANRNNDKRTDHLKGYAMLGGFTHGDPICPSCVRYDEIARQRKKLITDPLASQVVLMLDHGERTPKLTPQARGASPATSPSTR